RIPLGMFSVFARMMLRYERLERSRGRSPRARNRRAASASLRPSRTFGAPALRSRIWFTGVSRGADELATRSTEPVFDPSRELQARRAPLCGPGGLLERVLESLEGPDVALAHSVGHHRGEHLERAAGVGAEPGLSLGILFHPRKVCHV